ncbi:hypothetical protein C0J52_04728 [Blattella germanica]|nr:hypothetical protein C0J52_04728 [Blattella germanica]
MNKIEAAEACKWLRAAGFPQYAQMYEVRSILRFSCKTNINVTLTPNSATKVLGLTHPFRDESSVPVNNVLYRFSIYQQMNNHPSYFSTTN